MHTQQSTSSIPKQRLSFADQSTDTYRLVSVQKHTSTPDMLTAQRPVLASGRVATHSSPALPARLARTSVVRRYRVDGRPEDGNENEAVQTRLSQEQIDEVVKTPAGKISPKRAELRADMGNAINDPAIADTAGPLQTMQAFDGPLPETYNGRLCMLAVPIALAEEWANGMGMLEQFSAHPARVFGITFLLLVATAAPILRGYTRKEPYAISIWTPMAENWNGRLAMLGFVGMLATEAITGVNTLQALGLQAVASSLNTVTGL